MPKTILIIEDEELLREMYVQGFEQSGMITYSANNAKNGIRMLDKNPDLVLLDMLLPENNGLFFLEEIRKNHKTKNTTVVVFSNYDNPSVRKKAKELGAIDYLLKTDYTPKEIIEKIKTFI